MDENILNSLFQTLEKLFPGYTQSVLASIILDKSNPFCLGFIKEVKVKIDTITRIKIKIIKLMKKNLSLFFLSFFLKIHRQNMTIILQ